MLSCSLYYLTLLNIIMCYIAFYQLNWYQLTVISFVLWSHFEHMDLKLGNLIQSSWEVYVLDSGKTLFCETKWRLVAEQRRSRRLEKASQEAMVYCTCVHVKGYGELDFYNGHVRAVGSGDSQALVINQMKWGREREREIFQRQPDN